MRSFVQVRTPSRTPSILDLREGGATYRFALLHVGREEHMRPAGKRRQHQEHAHPVYHAVLYTRGENRFLLNGDARPIRPGALALTGPADTHCFAPLDPGAIQYVEMTFALRSGEKPLALPFADLLGRYAGREVILADPLVTVAPAVMRALAGRIALLLAQLDSRGPPSWFAAYRTVLDALGILAEEALEGSQPLAQKEDSRLHHARRAIERRFAERLAVRDLAREAHLSTGHFIRAFKQRFGASPIAYQQEARLRAARTLLANTDLLCKEVAARVGFEDPYYFSRVFKRATGRAPGQYRRQFRSESAAPDEAASPGDRVGISGAP